jgi:3-amino-4-hydroxybenzoic acid synthase
MKNVSQKVVWIDGRQLADKQKTLMKVYHGSFEKLLVKVGDLGKIKVPQKIQFVTEVGTKEDLKLVPENSIILSRKTDLLYEAKKDNCKTAFMCTIQDDASMNEAWQLGSNFDYLVVDLIADTNIPLELLIAKLQPTNAVLIKRVTNALSAKIAFGVMEAGSDGVLLDTTDVKEIVNMENLIQKEKYGNMKLLKGKVINVEHAGMGYRACIDTTNLLNQNEGMVIGSTSNGGLLVSSETHYLPYMDLRPFRVNAGAVHSYVWCPDNQTAYLTELKGGSTVLCVDTNGNTREVTVGRTKTEMRPLLKIEVEAEGHVVNAFVQDDWHIRIFGGQGEPRNASSIKVGEELLVYICDNGRHVGIKIDESIEEK